MCLMTCEGHSELDGDAVDGVIDCVPRRSAPRTHIPHLPHLADLNPLLREDI
jgi:hypothetical protein